MVDKDTRLSALLPDYMPTSTPAPYDVNFCFPVRELENDRVKLTPFIPAQHAELFFQGSSSHPELTQHVPFGPFSSAAAFTEHLNDRIQPNPGMMLYAILDKTRSGGSQASPADEIIPCETNFAGTIGYLFASSAHLVVEIGYVFVLPAFRRTHIATNAVGLLLRYALDLPTATPPGLGLRRVQWQASELNEASIRVAERMGLRKEARLRWDRVFEGDQGKVGNGEAIREGDPRPGTLGRHSVILAICWDDWENGWREQVARIMDR